LTFCALNKKNEALKNANESVELKPFNANMWENLGYIQYYFKDYLAARLSLEKALELGNMDNYIKEDFYFAYASTLYELGEQDKALENVLNGLEIEPNSKILKSLYNKIK
jgi:tetratricopeptide (TPR) repeat protein